MNTTTTKSVKITKAMRFAELLTYAEVQENPGMVEFINHELELLSKKNSSGEKKPTKVQAENAHLQEVIFENMEDNRQYSIAEIQKEIPACAEFSNQKISALLRGLRNAGKVERTEEKGKAYFTVIR